ncbi:MAG: COX15/CtaA family protein, partial [candidate division Zixibacteria bacterium]|nr:COX15/CtaA family protein [candidate division Zixibacteria bacterium]
MNNAENKLYNQRLHRFAILTAAAAVILIVAGATVTSTGSGDSVPDWPLSYGTLTPPMIGGILWEHSHRLIAGITGILIGILAIWLWRKEPRKTVKWLGMAALVAVIIQAVLGGLRVLIVSTEGVQEAAVQLTGSES